LKVGGVKGKMVVKSFLVWGKFGVLRFGKGCYFGNVDVYGGRTGRVERHFEKLVNVINNIYTYIIL
jgi:hypothetical protein